MKGRQYRGRILPGPTALILGAHALPVGKVVEETATPQLKVLGITDEFAQCERTGSTLDRLSAALEKGQEDDDEEENVKTHGKKEAPRTKPKSSAQKTQ